VKSDKGEFLLEHVHYLTPLFRESSIPIKNSEKKTFFVRTETIGRNKEILSLYYFLCNYYNDPFELIISELEKLSKTEIMNPSLEIIHLCEKLITKQLYSRKLTETPSINLAHYKFLATVIIQDIKQANPHKKKDLSIKITLDESTPEDPGLRIHYLFSCSNFDIKKLPTTSNDKLFELTEVSCDSESDNT